MLVSNSVAARDKYKATKKGALTGALSAAAGGAYAYGALGYTMKLMAKQPPEAKKGFLAQMAESFAKTGTDMSKTTVSKQIKKVFGKMKDPKTIAIGLAAGALIGGAIGLAVDFYKNHKAKKA